MARNTMATRRQHQNSNNIIHQHLVQHNTRRYMSTVRHSLATEYSHESRIDGRETLIDGVAHLSIIAAVEGLNSRAGDSLETVALRPSSLVRIVKEKKGTELFALNKRGSCLRHAHLFITLVRHHPYNWNEHRSNVQGKRSRQNSQESCKLRYFCASCFIRT